MPGGAASPNGRLQSAATNTNVTAHAIVSLISNNPALREQSHKVWRILNRMREDREKKELRGALDQIPYGTEKINIEPPSISENIEQWLKGKFLYTGFNPYAGGGRRSKNVEDRRGK